MTDDAKRDEVAAAIAGSQGVDWDEVCAYEQNEDADHCDSGTCVAAHFEDHDPWVARSIYRTMADAAIKCLDAQESER